jgi:hypothetical protein
VRKLRVKPKARRSRRGKPGQGKVGQVNASEPLMEAPSLLGAGSGGLHGNMGFAPRPFRSRAGLHPFTWCSQDTQDPGV